VVERKYFFFSTMNSLDDATFLFHYWIPYETVKMCDRVTFQVRKT